MINKQENNGLSNRLKSVAAMVTPNSRLCDVGCDHGFLSIYLYQNGIITGGIASDVRKGPLSAATEHIKAAGLESVLETRLSDGLMNIEPGEANSLVIAGMGGPLIVSILEAKPEVSNAFAEIIIEPQSQIKELRYALERLKLCIADEDFVFEEGKYYPVFKLIPKSKYTCEQTKQDELMYASLVEILSKESVDNPQETLNEIKYTYGYINVYRKNKVLIQYLDYEYRLLGNIVQNLDKQSHMERLALLNNQMNLNRLTMRMCK